MRGGGGGRPPPPPPLRLLPGPCCHRTNRGFPLPERTARALNGFHRIPSPSKVWLPRYSGSRGNAVTGREIEQRPPQLGCGGLCLLYAEKAVERRGAGPTRSGGAPADQRSASQSSTASRKWRGESWAALKRAASARTSSLWRERSQRAETGFHTPRRYW